MGALRVAHLLSLRVLATLLAAGGAVAVVSIRGMKRLRGPAQAAAGIRDRAIVGPWLGHSAKLVLGTLAYNAFVFFIIEPILRIWFPPLKPWEHVTGIFGSSRTTYEEIVPTVATALWIAGNALVIVLLNRRLQVAREVSTVTQAPNDLYAPSDSIHAADSLVGAGTGDARGHR